MSGAQKHKKDSQFVSLIMLSGSGREKAAHKYVDEISLGSISSTFYVQLLHMQILKV
jgi:hypothetical protein